MIQTWSIIIAILLMAYLLGSIPTGYLAGRLLQGIDIREHGSGGTGATNVLRTLGKGPGTIVLLIDVLKGMASIALIYILYHYTPWYPPISWKPWLIMSAGLMAIVGHSKSVWIGFSGGKSVATSLGVLIAMSPIVGFSTLAIFSIILGIWRMVSLGSIIAAIAVTILMFVFNQPLPYQLLAMIASIFVILRHKGNIDRILKGIEPKIGQKLDQVAN